MVTVIIIAHQIYLYTSCGLPWIPATPCAIKTLNGFVVDAAYPICGPKNTIMKVVMESYPIAKKIGINIT